MASASWNPAGVALTITATAGTVTRTSATKFTVVVNASWTSNSGTNWGMKVTSGGKTIYIPAYDGTVWKRSGSGTLTGTYDISGNGSQKKTISVSFNNYKTDVTGASATKALSVEVTVPAWTSYSVKYNANGGSGAPSAQTKWKDQTLTLSTTKPTRTGYSFQGWGTSASDTSVDYAAGAKYTANAAITLYAIWKVNTYKVTYNANGGTGAPSEQTKTYGVTLTLSSIIPTKQYYNFLGWATSSTSNTVIYKAGSSYTSNTDITLYAVWELAYVKPRITNLTVQRHDGSYPTDEGRAVFVEFNWETDYPATSISISWKRSIDNEWDGLIEKMEGNSSEQNGIVGDLIGNPDLDAPDSFSTDYAYDVRVIVTDIETTTVIVTLPAAFFPIDVYKEGKGVAFGKAAELEGVAEVGFKLKTTGGLQYPILGNGSDLNSEELLIPNKYILSSVQASGYICGDQPFPFTSGTGMLSIESFGPEGQVKQTVEVCHKTNPLKFERYYYQGEWGSWCEAGGYKSAITVGFTSDVTLGVVNSYTQTPFNRLVGSKAGSLSLTDYYVKIGTGVQRVMVNGVMRINTGSTAGVRHARIVKKSGDTVTYITWINIKLAASDQMELCFTPVVCNVTKDDLLYVVFYTPDSTDVIYAGSTSNGIQSYLTVESI